MISLHLVHAGKNCDRGRERAGTFCVLSTILIDIVRDTEESTHGDQKDVAPSSRSV